MVSLLTREEMHNRVDSVFDQMEEALDDECLAVIGELDGNAGVRTRDDILRLHSEIAYPDYVMRDGAFQLGEQLRQPSRRKMYGTLVMPRSVVSEVVDDAVFGEVEEARQAIGVGDPEAYDG